MPVASIPSGTGPATLPDVGALAYNGVKWSALYKSVVEGQVVKDEARRTTKVMEWSIVADGVVTLPDGAPSTDREFLNLRRQLSVQGQALTYEGNGFGGLNVNLPGAPTDVAFGPVPEVIHFQPLGQGRSAILRWRVTTRIPELAPTVSGGTTLKAGSTVVNTLPVATQGPPALNPGSVLQFNYESSVSFDEQGYSHLSIRGTLEVPLNRTAPFLRSISATVDDYRQRWLNIRVDLTKFRVTRRNFNYSRDKRTVEFEFTAEELGPMGLPPGCTEARGTMSVRQMRLGGGGKMPVLTGVRWMVTLRATYVVAVNYPRDTAFYAFLALWWYRMQCGNKGMTPLTNNPANAPQQDTVSNVAKNVLDFTGNYIFPFTNFFGLTPGAGLVQAGGQQALQFYNSVFGTADTKTPKQDTWNVIPADFGFEEGLYLDSKSISFEASWTLGCRLKDIMIASGVWRWLPPTAGTPPQALIGGGAWAASMRSIMGWSSWLSNRLNPEADAIIDLGGGNPPISNPFR